MNENVNIDEHQNYPDSEQTINVPTMKVLPLKKICMTIGELPTSYLMSMTYLEQVTWLCNYLEKTIIPALNQNGEAVKELQELYELLRTYVNDYFDNLDVQEEINNKLDEMAERGQLADIIAQYLGLAGVLAFNTIDDLENAENITNGSICRCLGENSYNDGNGAFYKIRTITSSDVVDGYNIISLDVSPTLIGERIVNLDVNNLKKEMSLLYNKKVIILGDSYANRENSWADRLKLALNLSDENCNIKRVSGTGIYATVDNVNFSTMVVDNITINPLEVTDIIACCGYNDQYASENDFNTAFQTFVNVCKNNYPNAKIHIGFIGWCRPELTDYAIHVGNLNNTKQLYISNCSKYDNVHYLNNVEYALHDIVNIDDSYFHPTSNGQIILAQLIKQAFETGSCEYNSSQRNITSSFVKESYINTITGSFYSCISNNESRLFTNGEIFITFDETTSFTMDNSLMLKIGKLVDGSVQGRGLIITSGTVSALINTKNNGYFILPVTIMVDSGNIYLRLKVLNRNGNGWIADQLKYISIYGFDIKCNSMMQY